MHDPPLFHTIMTSAGTIIDIHDDGVLATSLHVQVHGTKLLFIWPGTQCNRKFFHVSHTTEHPLRLREAISEMGDEFKLTILNAGTTVHLEPGRIHAVVSPGNSTIACCEYVDAKMRDSAHIKEGVKWILDLIKTRRNPLPNDEDLMELYQPLIYGMRMWECLLQKLVEIPDETLAH